MKLSLKNTFLSTLSLSLLPQSFAAIVLGSQDNYQVAWIYGQNPCDHTTGISPVNSNPCGITFKLLNGHSYKFEHCGESTFALFNGDGSFNHGCNFNPKTLSCPNGDAHQTWVC
ncbi:hypothetical protein IFR05_007995 [Cadophora sp. M221]|nr:hypothetical protein IFR05_007995 [Cadophora sp. M221]